MDYILKELYTLLLKPYPGTKVLYYKQGCNTNIVVVIITHPSRRRVDKEQVYTEHKFYLDSNGQFSQGIIDKVYDMDDYLGVVI